MARPASFSGWLLEIEGRLSVQMNDYPRQNPAYRLTYFILKGRRKLRSFFIGPYLLGDIIGRHPQGQAFLEIRVWPNCQ